MTRPNWAADRTGPTGKLRIQTCPVCQRPVLRALVEGRDVRADPVPLDVRAELAVKLRGEWTFDIVRTWPGASTTRLCLRFAHHMAHRRYPVVGIHQCT